jgi:SAM-dependent methyltransferase
MRSIVRRVQQVLGAKNETNRIKLDWSADWNRQHPNLSSLDFIKFWHNDGLRNIIPPSNEMPAGYDEVAFLKRIRPALEADTVVEIGCGYGRMASAFPASRYRGLDVNPAAIEKARKHLAEYRFDVIDFDGPYPSADLYLAYTVFLHIDDKHIVTIARNLSSACRKLLIAEILDPNFRKAPSAVPNFVRSRADYETIFYSYRLDFELRRPYAHYPGKDLSYLLLTRKDSN